MLYKYFGLDYYCCLTQDYYLLGLSKKFNFRINLPAFYYPDYKIQWIIIINFRFNSYLYILLKDSLIFKKDLYFNQRQCSAVILATVFLRKINQLYSKAL